MDSTKYVGMDVHKDTISIAVMNSAGKVVMESILETKAATILQFIQGLRGNLLITFEEGTWAAWLYDLLKPHVTKVTVCNPRKTALLKSGNKSDRIDAQKLAELLRNGSLSAVYHGENGLRTLKELTRSYLTISKDLTRVMNRLKALYYSWGIACAGKQVYAPRHRFGMVEQDNGSGGALSSRVHLSTTRRAAGVTPRSAAGSFGREPETSARPNCYARFRGSVRSGRLFWSRSFRPRTGFARSGNCGPTAVWRSRRTAVGNIATWKVSYDVPRNP